MVHPNTSLGFEVLSTARVPEVEELFQDGYGDRFRPLALERAFSLATRIVGLRNEVGSLAAAAIFHRSRIQQATTSPMEPVPRVRTWLRLMEECHETGEVAWITIGEQHKSLHWGMARAGMERVADESTATAFLDDTDNVDRYDIIQEEGGLVVVTRPSSTENAGHRQFMWAWPDRPLDELITSEV